MMSMLRLFCLKTSSIGSFDHFSDLHEQKEMILSEYPPLTWDTKSLFFFFDGHDSYLGFSFQGPLKPQDEHLLPKGSIKDIRLLSKGTETDNGDFLLGLNQPFLAQSLLVDDNLKLMTFSGVDIDL